MRGRWAGRVGVVQPFCTRLHMRTDSVRRRISLQALLCCRVAEVAVELQVADETVRFCAGQEPFRNGGATSAKAELCTRS